MSSYSRFKTASNVISPEIKSFPFMPDVKIEPYTAVYKNDVAGLILGIQVGEFGIPITLDLQPDLAQISSFYQTNGGNFWVAKIDNKVIGTIALLDIGNQQGALRKMFVDKNYRGKELGVGQRLLTTLIEWSRDHGIQEIFLGTTEKFTRAQQFYEKNHFEEIPKQALPKSFPVMEVDIKFYRLSV
jgi:N-acetylglutamate synthase-like GNAT family acetyltransferase